MGGKLRPIAWAAIAVAGDCLLLVLIVAGTAQWQFANAANLPPPVSSAVLSLGALSIFVSSLLTAWALHILGVRSPSAYLANALGSAAVGYHTFVCSIGIINERLMAAVDMREGWMLTAPPYLEALKVAARNFTSFDGVLFLMYFYYGGVGLAALVVSLVCGGLFWLFVVRRSAR